jgi:hypothetical protein
MGLTGRVSTHVAALLVASLLAAAVPVLTLTDSLAQGACLAEQEPNDDPETATGLGFAAGALCLEGALPTGDQDIVAWEVPAAAAATPWSFEVSGIRGTLTSLRLLAIESEPGVVPVAVGRTVLTLEAPPDALAPVVSDDLLLPPGRYLLAIVRSGGVDGAEPPDTSYTASVRAGAPLPPSADAEPNDLADASSPLTGAFESSGDLQGSADHYRWTVLEPAAGTGWEIELRAVVGANVTLTLAGPDGAHLAAAPSDALGSARLVDLRLEPGDYGIVLSGGADTPLPYLLRARASPGLADAEPNDRPSLAIPLDPEAPLARGRLFPAYDTDTYRLDIDAAEGAVLRDVRLIWPGGIRRQLCLTLADSTTLQCRDGHDGIILPSLGLPAGEYYLAVSGEPDAERRYLLRVDEVAERDPAFETEPNDSPATANSWDAGVVMRGWGEPGDVDTFRLAVGGEPQLWEVRLAGEGIERLSWLRPDGRSLAREDVVSGTTEASLSDLFMAPGEHLFAVSARGEYRLEVAPLGPPDPDGEREPNDEPAFAEAYRLSRERVVGRLPRLRDVDVFRFTLAAPERLVLRVTPPEDGAIDLRLDAGGTVGQRRSPGLGLETVYDVHLPPGDYEASLTPATPSLGRYAFTIERADPFSLAVDQEPNDGPETARDLPTTLRIDGSGGRDGDHDWYRIPEPLAAGDVVTVRTTGSVSRVRLVGPTGDVAGELDPRTGVYTSAPLPEGGAFLLDLDVFGDHTAEVSAPGLTAAPPPRELPVRLDLTTDVVEVAAWWPLGQRLEASLVLVNEGVAAETLELDAVTSHFAWSAVPGSGEVQVPAGASLVVPLVVTALADAWADEPVRISVRARDRDGAQRTAAIVVTPRREAAPVAPMLSWPLPDALLGGLDVASLGLGGTPIPTVDPTLEAELHDGLSHTARGFWASDALLPLTLGVDLAGEAALPIVGTILDPQAADAFPGDVPRRFELLLSEDGATWAVALEGELSPLMREQAFVLPEAVPARFAQLRIWSTWPGGFARVALGEWKVVAAPGSAPGTEPLDLAEPTSGGHVSWMEPQPPDPGFAASILTADSAAGPVWTEGGDRVSWAVGFRDGRAAQVERIEWQDPVPSTPGARLERVEVEMSLEGPAGPWRPLGEWPLERAPDGSVAALELAEPAWARFLRFSGRAPGEGSVALELPDKLRVIERATGEGYRSVLGEWGAASPAGPWEWLSSPDVAVVTGEGPAPAGDTVAGGTQAEPQALPAGERVGGGIGGAGEPRWFAFSVPEGHNAVAIDVEGQPFLAVALTLFDAEGFRVPVLFGPGEAPGSVRYSAEVTPGAAYRLRVERPPSSIVFAYDTSGSMGPYLDFVYQALRAFTADVRPGLEAILIAPFEQEPLLDGWSDQPYILQNAVDRALVTSGSSSAETALIEATTALSARQGARAVLLVTDAETSSYQRSRELWRILASVRPLVFAVHVAAAGEPFQSRAWMQDWAQAAGGVYQYTRSHGEMDRAFDRLATWLRRPATYALTLSTSFQEEPPPSRKPGSLAVASPPGSGGGVALAPDVSVGVILDTSGSMLERLGRKRRIDVARAVLGDLLGERLPAGTQVALRVFGDRAAPCDTRLAVPLGPLDPEAMSGLIEGLRIDRRTKTPIGAALAEVPADLGGATGTRIIVLVTDGDETCGGDPAGAIRDLRRQGIDARVNLVGFALDDRKLKSRMRRWARAGNGSYFDARDQKALGRALRLAVSAPYRVLDEAGNEVASGTVDGDAVALEPGAYSVLVLSDPVARFDGVGIAPGADVSLTLPVIDLPSEGQSLP